jgi:hypothetical protein
MSTRVQYVEPSATITVGGLELDRWRRAFEETGTWVAPEFLAHVYVERPRTGEFMVGAVTRTESVFRYIEAEPQCVSWKTNRATGQVFGVIDLQCFWGCGFEADFYRNPSASIRITTTLPFHVRSLTHTCANCGGREYEVRWEGANLPPAFGNRAGEQQSEE